MALKGNFKIKYNVKDHIEFINDIFNFINENNEYGIGYPRCDDFNELASEVQVYENTVDNSICLIFHEDKLIGFGGFLYTEGETSGYLIGPLLKKEYPTKENIKEIINLILENSNYKFKSLIGVCLKENTVLNESYLESGLVHKSTQREMCFDIDKKERKVDYNIKELKNEEVANSEEVFGILSKTFEWGEDRENFEELLRDEYKTACVFNEENKIVGLVVWAFLQDVSFSRLEYLVVDEEYRRRGIGKAMINYVINDSKDMENIYLSTGIKNNAVNLYSKIGFYDTLVSNIYERVFP